MQESDYIIYNIKIIDVLKEWSGQDIDIIEELERNLIIVRYVF